jgi:hypothetical protein
MTFIPAALALIFVLLCSPSSAEDQRRWIEITKQKNVVIYFDATTITKQEGGARYWTMGKVSPEKGTRQSEVVVRTLKEADCKGKRVRVLYRNTLLVDSQKSVEENDLQPWKYVVADSPNEWEVVFMCNLVNSDYFPQSQAKGAGVGKP